jgi:hypothetical protein
MIRKTGRYAAQGPEAEFEPGSRGRVLRPAWIRRLGLEASLARGGFAGAGSQILERYADTLYGG